MYSESDWVTISTVSLNNSVWVQRLDLLWRMNSRSTCFAHLQLQLVGVCSCNGMTCCSRSWHFCSVFEPGLTSGSAKRSGHRPAWIFVHSQWEWIVCPAFSRESEQSASWMVSILFWSKLWICYIASTSRYIYCSSYSCRVHCQFDTENSTGDWVDSD